MHALELFVAHHYYLAASCLSLPAFHPYYLASHRLHLQFSPFTVHLPVISALAVLEYASQELHSCPNAAYCQLANTHMLAAHTFCTCLLNVLLASITYIRTVKITVPIFILRHFCVPFNFVPQVAQKLNLFLVHTALDSTLSSNSLSLSNSQATVAICNTVVTFQSSADPTLILTITGFLMAKQHVAPTNCHNLLLARPDPKSQRI